MKTDTEIFSHNYGFTEGLRWHNGYLWFCDLWKKNIHCISPEGTELACYPMEDEPVALGWLSDGRMLASVLKSRKLLIQDNGQWSEYASLAMTTPGYAHDFTVSLKDTVYISTSGFYPAYKANVTPSPILMVDSNQVLSVAVEDVAYPNGIVITPNQKFLIIAETFASRISCYEIQKDGRLRWHSYLICFDTLGFKVYFDKQGIPIDKSRHCPDGICFDPFRQAIWVASPGKNQVLCVSLDGTILKNFSTHAPPFDCQLDDTGNRLYIASSMMDPHRDTGNIEIIGNID